MVWLPGQPVVAVGAGRGRDRACRRLYGIRTSARLGTILGLSEIAVFAVLAVFFVVHAGSHNTLSVFTTKYTPPGFRGISGVIGGSVYTILAFGGFEGAAPLAEEARNPRRTIPGRCCWPPC